MKYDAIVIGGGIMGMATAFFLDRAGLKTALLEKSKIGSGASFGNACYVSPSHFYPLPNPNALKKGLLWLLNPKSPFYFKPTLDLGRIHWLLRFAANCTKAKAESGCRPLFDLLLYNKNLLTELEKENLFPFTHHKNGLGYLFRSKSALEAQQKEKSWYRELGIRCKVYRKDEFGALDANLEKADASFATYFEIDSHLEVKGFLENMRRYLAERNVDFFENTPVKSIEKKNHRVRRVHTEKRSFETSECVLANGAWISGAESPLEKKLPVEAAKGYSLTAPTPANAPKIPFILAEQKVALTPLGDRFRIGGTLEIDGMSPKVNLGRVRQLTVALKRYLPAVDFRPGKPETAWHGFRTCTPDGLPIIDRLANEGNLIVCTGHNMIGISTGMATGKIASDMILNQTPEIETRPFSAKRFR